MVTSASAAKIDILLEHDNTELTENGGGGAMKDTEDTTIHDDILNGEGLAVALDVDESNENSNGDDRQVLPVAVEYDPVTGR